MLVVTSHRIPLETSDTKMSVCVMAINKNFLFNADIAVSSIRSEKQICLSLTLRDDAKASQSGGQRWLL
jgi:hypothetical protein